MHVKVDGGHFVLDAVCSYRWNFIKPIIDRYNHADRAKSLLLFIGVSGRREKFT